VVASPILFIDHAPALGGAEYAMLMILDRLDRDQWQPHLACSGGPLPDRAAVLNVPVHTVPLPRLRRSLHVPLHLWKGVQALIRTAKATKAVLLVANTVRAAFYAALAAQLTGIPLVWYRHDFWLGESAPRYPTIDTALKHLLSTASIRLICNSMATAQQHPCQHKITVVHNGIEIQRFKPTMSGIPFRQAYSIPVDVPLLGMVGRLSHVKGQDRYLRVLAQVQAAMPGVWGLVVGGAIFGEDDYSNRLYRIAQELRIDQQLVFTGQLDNPVPALAAMDIFVQPGDPEAFGLVNVEAMAMAKPVVGFKHGALPEIVVNGQTGLLVDSGDEAALTAAIVHLLRNPPLRLHMGQAGRAHTMEHFTIERVVAQVSEVFQRITLSSE
jgi:glycosyltransferase involved in cell wall biosynthesis